MEKKTTENDVSDINMLPFLYNLNNLEHFSNGFWVELHLFQAFPPLIYPRLILFGGTEKNIGLKSFITLRLSELPNGVKSIAK